MPIVVVARIRPRQSLTARPRSSCDRSATGRATCGRPGPRARGRSPRGCRRWPGSRRPRGRSRGRRRAGASGPRRSRAGPPCGGRPARDQSRTELGPRLEAASLLDRPLPGAPEHRAHDVNRKDDLDPAGLPGRRRQAAARCAASDAGDVLFHVASPVPERLHRACHLGPRRVGFGEASANRYRAVTRRQGGAGGRDGGGTALSSGRGGEHERGRPCARVGRVLRGRAPAAVARAAGLVRARADDGAAQGADRDHGDRRADRPRPGRAARDRAVGGDAAGRPPGRARLRRGARRTRPIGASPGRARPRRRGRCSTSSARRTGSTSNRCWPGSSRPSSRRCGPRSRSWRARPSGSWPSSRAAWRRSASSRVGRPARSASAGSGLGEATVVPVHRPVDRASAPWTGAGAPRRARPEAGRRRSARAAHSAARSRSRWMVVPSIRLSRSAASRSATVSSRTVVRDDGPCTALARSSKSRPGRRGRRGATGRPRS